MTLRVLDAAVSIIEKSGERALRMRQVAQLAGIAEPTLYHYFKSREDLIVAAHARRYRTELSVTVDPFLDAVRRCESAEQFISIVLAVYENSFRPERVSVRATRAEVVGAAHRRDGLRLEVRDAMQQSLAPTIEALNFAQAKGWLRRDIDTTAFAYFNLALVSGMVFPEIQGDTNLMENWMKIARATLTAFLATDTASDTSPPTSQEAS